MTDIDTDVPSFDDDFDTDDFPELHVNFTDEEAASKALEALPTGKYKVTITKCELKKSQSAKNNGKPMYAMTFKVFDGPYAKRQIWSYIMLWDGALYSLNQLMNATGFSTRSGQIRVPRPSELIGKQLTVRGIKVPPKDGYDEKFEVKGYKALEGATSVAAGSDDLDP
jgi:hypothetical protein